jgi:SAM-dependent methyltransferase
MSERAAIDHLFSGLPQLGPGSDAKTKLMLHDLPSGDRAVIVDAGCGNGRQTLVLAGWFHQTVHAIDNHAPFLRAPEARAAEAGLAPFIQTHCLDMAEIPERFRDVDLRWSEGAAYNLGFTQALETWRDVLCPGGVLGVSELCWLTHDPPEAARQFFRKSTRR